MSTQALDSAHAAAVAVANAVQNGTTMRATMTDLDWAAVCGTSILIGRRRGLLAIADGSGLVRGFRSRAR